MLGYTPLATAPLAVLSSGGSGAVLPDAVSTTSVKATNATSLLLDNITVGNGQDRALVVWLVLDFFGHSAPTNISLVSDEGGTSVPLTLIKSASTSLQIIQLYGLVGPLPGPKSLTANWTGTVAGAEMYAESFTGGDQTGGVTTFRNAVSLNGTKTTNLNNERSAALSVTSAVGNMAIVGWIADSSVDSVDQTPVWLSDNTTTDGAGSRAAGAAAPIPFTMTFSGNNSTPYAAIGFDLLAATVGGGGSGVQASIRPMWNLTGRISASLTFDWQVKDLIVRWDAVNKAANVTLSNGDLTATAS